MLNFLKKIVDYMMLIDIEYDFLSDFGLNLIGRLNLHTKYKAKNKEISDIKIKYDEKNIINNIIMEIKRPEKITDRINQRLEIYSKLSELSFTIKYALQTEGLYKDYYKFTKIKEYGFFTNTSLTIFFTNQKIIISVYKK